MIFDNHRKSDFVDAIALGALRIRPAKTWSRTLKPSPDAAK